MKNRFTRHFYRILDSAKLLARESESEAILLMMPLGDDWEGLKKAAEDIQVIVVSCDPELIASASEHELDVIELTKSEATIQEQMSNALLTGIADEVFRPGADVVAMYSAFDIDRIDSVSLVQLDEHLGRLTTRDLQSIETKVPLDILKTVVDLAIEIGREGREGKPVGTMFVVGDHRKVMDHSHPASFELTKGYKRAERNIQDSKVREALKELAQLDGSFVIANDGTVEGACRIIDTSPVELMLSHGLGSRHWAGAAISKNTNSVAIVVSESSGTVRIFKNGETVLRIEPFRRRPMTWTDFGAEDGVRGEDE